MERNAQALKELDDRLAQFGRDANTLQTKVNQLREELEKQRTTANNNSATRQGLEEKVTQLEREVVDPLARREAALSRLITRIEADIEKLSRELGLPKDYY